MPCFIYASARKTGGYLWLAQRDDFTVLPDTLVMLLGELRFVMELTLDEQRKLPHEDAAQVLEHLRTRGWHLQVPPAETLGATRQLDYLHSRRNDPTQ
jgi:uncharacterized protein YcgL (UPF0745 family)